MAPPHSEIDLCRNFSSDSRKGLTSFEPVPEMVAKIEPQNLLIRKQLHTTLEVIYL